MTVFSEVIDIEEELTNINRGTFFAAGFFDGRVGRTSD